MLTACRSAGWTFSRFCRHKVIENGLRTPLRASSGFVGERFKKKAGEEEDGAFKNRSNEEASSEEQFEGYQRDENQQQQKSKDPFAELIETERMYSLNEFEKPKIYEPEPIISLNLKPRVKQVYKEGSFIRNLFIGEFDKDFLAYPEVLRSRHEYRALVKQNETILKYFKGLVMRNPEDNFRSFGFRSLWFLTKTEMINIIETVGRSMALNALNAVKRNVEHEPIDMLNRPSCHPVFNPKDQESILSLIMSNTSIGCIQASNNETIKERLVNELNRKPNLKVAFAWSEPVYSRKMHVDPCIDFECTAKVTTDGKYWVVNGIKNQIVDDDYDYYLVFAATNDYPENVARPSYLLDQPIPYAGLVTILVPANMVAVKEKYMENGITYQRVDIQDIMLSLDEYEVLPAQVDGVRAVNYKGLAQLGQSSYLLGQMKAAQEAVYYYLLTEKVALTKCEAIADILSEMTCIIYGLESCLYLSTAMFDAFRQEGNPECHLEAAITKVLAIEGARNFNLLLQKVYGHRLVHTSPFDDMINIFDTMLDSTFSNRLTIGYQGCELAGEKKTKYTRKSSDASPGLLRRMERNLKRKMLSEEDILKLRGVMDLEGYIHPTLGIGGRVLEHCIRRLSYATELVLDRFLVDFETRPQSDLNELASMAIQIFRFTCMLSRTSRAYCETLRNADMDCHLIVRETQATWDTVRSIYNRMDREEQDFTSWNDKAILDRTQYEEGYPFLAALNCFPKHPVEPVAYFISPYGKNRDSDARAGRNTNRYA